VNRLEGKVAIVTGAGDGVGRVMARLFSDEGAKVAIAGRREDKLRETAEGIAGEVLVVPTDITDEEAVIEMVRATVERFGQVDVLINNAAQPGVDKYIWEQTLDNWTQTIAVDTTGAMLCMREVLRQSMLERTSGSIVSFSSTAGSNGMPRKSHYCTAKAALRTLTKVAAQEAGPYGIRVNCLIPGGIQTDLYLNWVKRMADEQDRPWEEVATEFASNTALRRVTTPDEQAAVALFLASDESSGITGQSIIADAGGVMNG
jgi:3-oxoacyl-[acyl-carrier protein] reductase